MPPKPKYTKDAITEAAYNIVCERGAGVLTAREIAKSLGTSPTPIFTCFKDMDEVKNEVRRRAADKLNEYLKVSENYFPKYKKRGMQWVKFACEQPELFKFLFMEGTDYKNFDDAMHFIPFDSDADLEIISHDYKADSEQALHLFRQMWIFTYGLCVICATGLCKFTEDEIAVRLGEIFRGMVYVLNTQSDDPAKKPVEGGHSEYWGTPPDLSAGKTAAMHKKG